MITTLDASWKIQCFVLVSMKAAWTRARGIPVVQQ